MPKPTPGKTRGNLSASFRKAHRTTAAKAVTHKSRRKKAREAASVGSGTKTTSLRSPRKAVGRTIRGRRGNAGDRPSRRMN